MELENSMFISAAGMRAQSARMRIISENIANQNSVADRPGGDPYRRKLITFVSELDRTLGIEVVKPGEVIRSRDPFGDRYDPGNPAADKRGYVKTSNVNGLVELMDMRQSERTYQANINALEGARRMMQQTVMLLQRGR